MRNVPCYHCGARLEGGPHCPACARFVDPEIAARIAAAKRLSVHVAASRDLGEELTDETQATIDRSIATLRARAAELETAALAAARAVTPPTSPAPDETPEPEQPAPPEPEPAPPAPTSPTPPIRRRHRRATPVEPAAPSVWARLGPVFAENILFTLAVFLIVGGAVFFVTTAWTTMTGTTRLLVVFGGLEAFGAILFAAGKLLNRGGTLPEVERALLVVTSFLVPIAGVVAGELLRISWPLGLLAGAVALATGFQATAAAARTLDRRLHPSLTWTVAGFALTAVFAPALGAVLGTTAVAAAVLLVLATRIVARSAAPPTSRHTAPMWIAVANLGFAALVLVAGAALHADGTLLDRLAPIGVVAAAIGLCVCLTERALTPDRDRQPGASAVVSLVIALAFGATGSVMATADPRLLLVAVAATSWTTFKIAARLERKALLWPGLLLSAIAYFLLPAPVRELAMTVRAWFAGSLGYAPEHLPMSFYGITFLPYLAATGLCARWLRRRAPPGFAEVTLAWTLAVALGLAVLSIVAGTDARAPTVVLGAEGAMLMALGAVTRRQRLVFAGALGLCGSVISALVHREAALAETLSVLAVTGLVAYAVAFWLQRHAGADAFRRRAAHALLDATLLLAVGTACHALLPPTARVSVGTAEVPGYLALAALVALLGRAYGASAAWFGPLAWALCGFGLLGALAGDATALLDPATALTFAAISVMPLALAVAGPRLALPARWRPDVSRPGLFPPLDAQDLPTVVSVLLLQAFALPAVLVTIDSAATATWATAAGLCLGGGAVLATAAWSGRSVLTFLASAQVLAGALLGAGVLADDPGGPAGTAGLALGALALASVQLAVRRAGRARRVFEPLGVGVIAGVGLALLTGIARRAAAELGGIPHDHALALALVVASAAGLVASVLAGWNARDKTTRRILGALATVVLPAIPIALCDLIGAHGAAYPLGVLAAAALARFVAGRAGPVAAAPSLGIALVMAVTLASRDLQGGFVLAATFALIGVVGRLALAGPTVRPAVALATLRAICVLVGGLGAIWFTILNAGLGADPKWFPAVGIGFAALATFAPAHKHLGVNRLGTGLLVVPITVLAGLAGLLHALLVIVAEGRPLYDPRHTHAPVDAMAAAMLALGLALGWHARPGRRAWWPVVFAVLAAFLSAPLNQLVQGPLSDAPWPDLEVAVTALVVALTARATADTTKAAAALTPRALFAYALALGALALTALEYRNPSTPITCAVLAAVPLALLFRERRADHADPFGYGVLVAAFATALYLVPVSGRPPIEVLLLLGTIAAALAIPFLAACHILRLRAPDSELARAVAPRFARLGTAAAVVGLALVAINLIGRAGTPADAGLCAFALVTCAVAGGIHMVRAVTERIAWPVHLAVAAALLGYAFCVERTTVLSPLDGYHLHAVTLLGAGLLFASRRAPAFLANQLAIDGLLLPIPALLVVGTKPSIEGALALLLAAGTYGAGALILRHRFLPWVSAALLNSAMFSLWLHHDIVDPAFYGVPAGLTLVIGGELTRARTARTLLWYSGLVVLYGSIAVQVARVEEPLHALVLFVAGLAAVGAGFVRRRNDFLLAGTTAVVVDVIAYLARHGLEHDFLGAALLVGSGLTVLLAAVAARRRRRGVASAAREP